MLLLWLKLQVMRFSRNFMKFLQKDIALYSDYEKRFKEVGVEIVYLPHTDGVSSTMIKDKIDK